ncbi:MAG: seg [Candidatus Adlerbacteria bacterium]|nr:seg [Candidatus Adlerbacteria bacterium]
MIKNKKGFTIFFAMLVGSLALAVGLAIYDLTVRELELSAAASQSQYAIYAADTGVECALYWDSKYGGSGSAFGTSTASTWGSSVLNCNGADIKVTPPPAADVTRYTECPASPSAWCTSSTASEATTTFSVSIPSGGTPAQTYCAVVQVSKVTLSGVLYTTILSRGYNNCQALGVARLERTLKVNY